MKLREYLKHRNITLRRMQQDLVTMFGNAPTHTTLGYLAAGTTEPKLELALMILRWSNGEVDAHDLLVDTKRNYTSPGQTIYGLEHTLNKTITSEKEKAPIQNSVVEPEKTLRERLDDPHDEVHEVDDEDLSAASDFFDDLLENL